MSRTKQSDTILYCENCGISFLWSIEEQHQISVQADDPASGQPTRCAGCRALLPPADRERGMVKWYNRRKRFGFIVRRNQPDLFVHGSQLKGKTHLKPDELVEFSVMETDKGLAASDVRVIQPEG